MPTMPRPDNLDALARDSVFARAPTGLLTADLDGVIVSINAAMERLLGMTPGAGRGRNLLALLDPPDQMCDLLEALLATGYAHERTISIDDGGGRRSLALSAALLPSAARADQQHVLVTGRHHQDTCPSVEAIDGATLMAASARLGGLIAHDLNNVLSVILGTCHLLETSRHDDDLARRDLASLLAASTEAALIVRQLATFGVARPLAPVPLQPEAALRELAPLVSQLLASELGLDLSADTAGGALVSDPAVFHDVIISLALEARRSMRNGDRVTLHLAPSPSGDEWRLHLRTQTPTMNDIDSNDSLPVDDGHARPPGIGRLAVARWVAAQGGRLEVATEGGSFAAEVAWPRVDAPGARMADEPAAAPQTRVVLVVDDNVRLREFVERVLKTGGYEVVGVGNGRRALEAIASRRFDAVVTDIRMPDMSGWDVGAAVSRHDPGCGIVYVSGDLVNGEDGDVIEARSANSLLLLKPFTTTRLLESVALACSVRPGPA
jgi:PAS domain S-box-containing protein